MNGLGRTPDPERGVPVFTTDTVSLRRVVEHPSGSIDVTIDLTGAEMRGPTRAGTGAPPSSRRLEPRELQAVVRAFQALRLNRTLEQREGGPPPGGSWRYEIRDRDGKTRVLAPDFGLPKGSSYFILTREQEQALASAWPAPVREQGEAVEFVVVFKKSVAAEAAGAIIGAQGLRFRAGGDNSRGKRYFYAAGPQFVVSVDTKGAERFVAAMLARPEVFEVYKADWSVQKD